MSRLPLHLTALAVWLTLLGAAPARAQAPALGQGWSTETGRTAGFGTTALTVSAGWPGLAVGMLYGVGPGADVGVQLGYAAGWEGTPAFVGATSELKMEAVVRLLLLEQGRWNLGLSFFPGALLSFWSNATYAGLLLPARLRGGLSVTDALNAFFGVDVPFSVTFGRFSSANLPLLFGGGAELFLNRNLAFSATLQMGPVVNLSTARADFGLQALLGMAYRL